VIEAHARETASEYASGGALASAFDELCRRSIERARATDTARLVHVWWGPNLRLDEFLKTRVLEVVVHGLDMTHALEREAVWSDAGLRMVRATLEGLIGGPAPAGWSDVELVEKGTGRAPLSEADAADLGPAANAFPLLG
jgi:hypothetical protein